MMLVKLLGEFIKTKNDAYMKKDWMIKESELDEDQIKVLMATLDKSCIVAGCAGSGKSILALIKAQRIQKERGNNYKVIVFTKALCHYMNTGRKELGLRNEFYYHWHWKNRMNCSPADYIIVDEIQDFDKDEISEFISATNKNFFFFGDTAQSIYEGLKSTVPVDDIRLEMSLPSSKAKNFELFRNYRLPLPVAKVAYKVGVDVGAFDEKTYKSPETAMPRFIKYDSQKSQIEAIHRIIGKNNLEDVAILLPHNEDVFNMHRQLSALGGNYEMRYNDKEDWRNSKDTLDFDSTNPKIMTYHSAKGLQFETVFLPFIENFEEIDEHGKSSRKALYVAMTRTYRYLYIMYTDNLPSPLSNIDKILYKENEVDTVEDW